MYNFLIFKNRIENILIFPFILLGKVLALLTQKRAEYDIFYFFPFYHIGGAEKLHYQIAQATGGKNAIIYFTRKSNSKLYYEQFRESGCEIIDISRLTDNKWVFFLNLIYRGFISYQINRQKKTPLIFNGQSNFGYKVSPWINARIPQLELIHAFNTFSYIRIPFIRFYKQNITVSQDIINKQFELYNRYKVPFELRKKFIFIQGKIVLPPLISEKRFEPFHVLYVGRGTPEKRVDLFALIAKEVTEKRIPVKFLLLGNVKSAIPEKLYQYCTFLGDISDEALVDNVYRSSHVIVITSTTESGPLVFMEGMARGLAVISTPVGYITQYIHNDKNGLVIQEIDDREMIVKKSADYILKLYHDKNLFEKISSNNLRIAYNEFGIAKFNTEYQNLFKKFLASN